jgi:hypothetical protein
MNSRRRIAPEGDANHPNIKGINPQGMGGMKIKSLKNS